MKRIIIIMVMAAVMLCACGKNSEKQGEADGQEIKATVSMFDLREAMLAADDTFPKMLSVSDSDDNPEKLFAYISDEFDYSRIEHFFVSYSSDTENPAAEVVVVALKELSDVEALRQALNAHIEHRIKMYEEYDPSSVSKVKKAMIFDENQYVVLIISEKTEAVKAAFEQFVK